MAKDKSNRSTQPKLNIQGKRLFLSNLTKLIVEGLIKCATCEQEYVPEKMMHLDGDFSMPFCESECLPFLEPSEQFQAMKKEKGVEVVRVSDTIAKLTREIEEQEKTEAEEREAAKLRREKLLAWVPEVVKPFQTNAAADIKKAFDPEALKANGDKTCPSPLHGDVPAMLPVLSSLVLTGTEKIDDLDLSFPTMVVVCNSCGTAINQEPDFKKAGIQAVSSSQAIVLPEFREKRIAEEKDRKAKAAIAAKRSAMLGKLTNGLVASSKNLQEARGIESAATKGANSGKPHVQLVTSAKAQETAAKPDSKDDKEDSDIRRWADEEHSKARGIELKDVKNVQEFTCKRCGTKGGSGQMKNINGRFVILCIPCADKIKASQAGCDGFEIRTSFLNRTIAMLEEQEQRRQQISSTPAPKPSSKPTSKAAAPTKAETEDLATRVDKAREDLKAKPTTPETPAPATPPVIEPPEGLTPEQLAEWQTMAAEEAAKNATPQPVVDETTPAEPTKAPKPKWQYDPVRDGKEGGTPAKAKGKNQSKDGGKNKKSGNKSRGNRGGNDGHDGMSKKDLRVAAKFGAVA